MCPSAGHAVPASARPAKQPSSRDTSTTALTRSNPRRTAVRSSAAHNPTRTWCSIYDRAARSSTVDQGRHQDPTGARPALEGNDCRITMHDVEVLVTSPEVALDGVAEFAVTGD